jgi:hypothetical protein
LIPQIWTQEGVTSPIELDNIRWKIFRRSRPEKTLRAILRVHSCDVAVRVPVNLLHLSALSHEIGIVALIDANGIDPEIPHADAPGDFHPMSESQGKLGVRYVDTLAELLVVLVRQLESVAHWNSPHVAQCGVRTLHTFLLGVSDKTDLWLLDGTDI